jgi:hypothetical protein
LKGIDVNVSVGIGGKILTSPEFLNEEKEKHLKIKKKKQKIINLKEEKKEADVEKEEKNEEKKKSEKENKNKNKKNQEWTLEKEMQEWLQESFLIIEHRVETNTFENVENEFQIIKTKRKIKPSRKHLENTEMLKEILEDNDHKRKRGREDEDYISGEDDSQDEKKKNILKKIKK